MGVLLAFTEKIIKVIRVMPNDTRKKILYVITKSNWGGAQRYVYDLATAMKKKGYEVVVACGDSRKKEGGLPGLLVQRLEKSGIKVKLVSSFRRDISIKKEFDAFKELGAIFKEVEPDIVHLNSSKAGVLGARAARKAGIKKIIFTAHGWPFKEDRGFLFKSFAEIGSKYTTSLVDKIIVVSKEDYELGIKKFPSAAKNITLIRNGVAPINFKSREEARRAIMGQPIKDTPWIGTIAEFTKNKGLSYLVEAASSLKKEGFSFRMSLIGGGEDLRKIKKQAEKNGLYNSPGSATYIDLLYFPGFIIDSANNLKAFEIFVLASVKEGLPYVLLEAGQAGLPVIATNVGGIPDVIENGVTGILINPKNPEELKNALIEYMKKPELRVEHGEALKKKVEKEFSLERMVTDTEKIYFP